MYFSPGICQLRWIAARWPHNFERGGATQCTRRQNTRTTPHTALCREPAFTIPADVRDARNLHPRESGGTRRSRRQTEHTREEKQTHSGNCFKLTCSHHFQTRSRRLAPGESRIGAWSDIAIVPPIIAAIPCSWSTLADTCRTKFKCHGMTCQGGAICDEWFATSLRPHPSPARFESNLGLWSKDSIPGLGFSKVMLELSKLGMGTAGGGCYTSAGTGGSRR